MDSTVLKIVQIFVSTPHLLLANMNSGRRASVCLIRARRSTSLMIIWLLNFLCLGANPRNGIANAADKQTG